MGDRVEPRTRTTGENDAFAGHRQSLLGLWSSHTLCIVGIDPLAIFTGRHFVDPRLVVEIPPHRFIDASLERFRWLPAEFTFELARVDSITVVMTRFIRDKANLVAI